MFSLGGAAFPRGYLRYDGLDADGLVGDWVKFLVTAGAVVFCKFIGDVLRGVSSFICGFACRSGGWEVRLVFAWDMRSCDGESRRLDLIV